MLTGSDGWSAVDPAAIAAVEKAPGVETVMGIRQDEARAFGEKTMVAAIDPARVRDTVRYDMSAGSEAALGRLGADGAVVRSDFAAEHGLKLGSPFTVTSRSGKRLALEVRAIERKPRTDLIGLGQVTVAGAAFDRAFDARENWISFVSIAGGVSGEAGRALERALAAFPAAQARDVDTYVDEAAGFIDQLLGVFYVLLALAVIVSLFGIVNTLVLSVFERTRELGMLRAIGMTRRQVRRMIRHESVITALLGATAGIAIGLGLAAIVATAFADEGFAFAIPAGSMVAFVIVAILAGIAAAALPARRAAKLDPLTALAYE